jgi:hypothetical protein
VLKGHTDQVRAVQFSPDGQWLVSVGLDGRIKIWDAITGHERTVFAKRSAGLLDAACSPDSRLLATGGDAGTVSVWETDTGRNRWSVKGHASWLSCLAFSPDGRWLASGSHDRTIKLWDAQTGQELRTLRGHENEIKALVFSPDSARLISGSGDNNLKIWDPATGEDLQTLKGHARGITSVALSRDGRWLASASSDRTVKVWDLTLGRERHTLKGHHDAVFSVAFNPDGTRLATAGWDKTVRIWDPATGFEVATLKGHTDRVLGVAFSPDGGRLAAAGGTDLTVRVWDGRPLTPEVQAELDALGEVEHLFALPLRQADVISQLRNSAMLAPPVRQLALTLASRCREESDPRKYHDAAWSLISHPFSNVHFCRVAVSQAKAAYSLVPDNPSFRITLGMALYRLGRFEKERFAEALAILSKCDQSQPATLAFLAMTQRQLGQTEQSAGQLAALRKLLTDPKWAGNREAEAFLREAEQ